MKNLIFFFLFFSFFLKKCVFCNEIYIAVSSNFLNTLQKISYNFEKENNCKIILSSDSTSNLFNKIRLGIPFDIFVSADAFHPKLLENKNNKSQIYAYGRILFFTKSFYIKKNFLFFLNNCKNIGLANSKFSPYGVASNLVFKNLNIKNKFFIFGSNINQTFNFIYFNNNEIGIIAFSQAIQNNLEKKFLWKIPRYLYSNIEQRLIVLERSDNKYLTNLFLNYINSKNIKIFIKSQGYKIDE